MALSYTRQIVVWTIPSLTIFLTYLWYRKKKGFSHQGDSRSTTKEKHTNLTQQTTDSEALTVAIVETPNTNRTTDLNNTIPSVQHTSPKMFCRSLSGTETAPIDIIFPKQANGPTSNSLVITDEDLDYEIEKIKSMKHNSNPCTFNSNNNNNNSSSNNNNNSNNARRKNSWKSPVVISQTMSERNKSEELNRTKSKDDFTIVASTVASAEEKKPIVVQSVEESDNSSQNNVPNTTPKLKSDEVKNENHPNTKTERDSANHSPIDVMLTSPSLSCISDNNSEGSNDSGKGGSEVTTTPPPPMPPTKQIVSNRPNTNNHTSSVVVTSSVPSDTTITTFPQRTEFIPVSMIYEFLIPHLLVGQLIGKNGKFLSTVRDKTNVRIIVREHPSIRKKQICSIQGYRQEVNDALKLLRARFPVERFPDLNLEQIDDDMSLDNCTIPIVNDHQLYLRLVEGINNDTIVSCMVAPNHLFLQQPTHPSFPNLSNLTNYMNFNYNSTDSPLLASPIPANTICVAFSVGSWYRAIVLSSDEENESAYVKFLDYGGYAYVENSQLRQIRADYMLLPFQAAECMLANVKPVGEKDSAWCEEAYSFVAESTKGSLMYTQIIDYSEDNVPLVNCYLIIGSQLIFLNNELVNKGYAEWINGEVSSKDDETLSPKEAEVKQNK